MAYTNDPKGALDHNDYSTRHTRLLRIARRLPQHKLEALARESMQRLIALGVGRTKTSEWERNKLVERLCAALLNEDEHLAARMVVTLLEEGVAPEAVYLDYLASAAKRLNEWWEHDKASFWQVTVATCRILAIMRSMGHLFEPEMTRNDRSAIFAGVPGEQHSVGLRMATDIFQKDGWDVILLIGLSHYALVKKIASTRSTVIGLSLGSTTSLDALSKLVLSLHIVRPKTPIFLNGNGVREIEHKLAWMDLAGVSDSLGHAKDIMNAWVGAHEE